MKKSIASLLLLFTLAFFFPTAAMAAANTAASAFSIFSAPHSPSEPQKNPDLLTRDDRVLF